MFRANLKGKIKSISGRDIHSRPSFAPERICPFAPINLKVKIDKTTVRADSSASRGSAQEKSVENARILVPSYVDVNIGDIFTYRGISYEIIAVHERYSVTGIFDHWELDMEIFQR